ncbi:hypothetical protein [Sessilibacter corallicola]|uniref:hypothetical protein n=1 Tax=Sessilibacter corallicola TaxID=2904075 RepID=UPI001E5C5892|nr:hypothetical protein [Sessilibacter corallicola]MCE2028498.1 hypothetical protein [Sessilibacter corallicola]
MSQINDADKIISLKEAVVKCTESESLNPEQLEKLSMMQRDLTPSKMADNTMEENIWRRWRPNFVVVTLLIVAMTWYTYSGNKVDYVQTVAHEVIENHMNLKPLETDADSISQAQNFFVQLDFVPSQSSHLNNQWDLNDDQLIGGRYCSIKGDSAAQLRYQQGEQLYTFYQVGYDKQLFGEFPNVDNGETPKEVVINGLKATLWIEKGLLMALVTKA